MEISAKCKFDFDSIKALTHLFIYKKSNPKKAIQLQMVLCCALLLVIIAELIVSGFDPVMFILIVTVLLIIALYSFMYFCLPKIRYNLLAKIKNSQNDYLFSDNVLKVLTKSDEYNGQAEIEYSVFVKVYETSAYFFLFQTNNQVFLVDKSTVTGGSIDDIRNKLSSYVKDKYFICKY